MTINLYPKNEVRVIEFMGTFPDPKQPDLRQVTHAVLSDGRTVPIDEVTPRMWKLAGLQLAGGRSNAR